MTSPVELVVEHEDSATVVRLTGEIDLSTAAGAESDIVELTDGAASIVLDLAGLTYLDSAGLAMLDALARRCREVGSSFSVVVPDDSVARTALAISGLDTVVRVHPTRAEAMLVSDDHLA